MTDQEFRDKLFRVFYSLCNDFAPEHKAQESKAVTTDEVTDAICRSIYNRLGIQEMRHDRLCREEAEKEAEQELSQCCATCNGTGLAGER